MRLPRPPADLLVIAAVLLVVGILGTLARRDLADAQVDRESTWISWRPDGHQKWIRVRVPFTSRPWYATHIQWPPDLNDSFHVHWESGAPACVFTASPTDPESGIGGGRTMSSNPGQHYAFILAPWRDRVWVASGGGCRDFGVDECWGAQCR